MRLHCRTQYNSDSEETTTKSTEQLDLCHCWQQTNHYPPYLNMCPRPKALLAQRRTEEESREGICFSHMMVVRICLLFPHSSPTFSSQRAFPNTQHSFSVMPSFLSLAFCKKQNEKRKHCFFGSPTCSLSCVVWIVKL